MTRTGHVRMSVQIVAWNSEQSLDPCLAALAAQTSRSFEVIVLDNASMDRSPDIAADWFARGLPGTLVRERTNTGFCGGQNAALDRASGDLVLFLNPDVVLPPGFIQAAITVADSLPPAVGSIAPCIALPDGRIDSTGLVKDRLCRAWDRDHGLTEVNRHAGEVFTCTGAVAVHRRAMLQDVAIDGKALDEVMFAYHDDLDLGWRAQLRGWRCQYVPALTAVHYREARNSLRARPHRPTRGRDQILTVRNRLLMMVKCESVGHALLFFPLYAAFEAARIVYLAFKAPGALSGYREFLAALPAALADRRRIQRNTTLRRSASVRTPAEELL